MKEPGDGKRKSPLVLIALLLGPLVAGFAISYLLLRPAASVPPEPQTQLGPTALLVEVLGSLVLGAVLLVLAALFYLVVVETSCLTFDFSRPVYRKVKPRLFLANIALAAVLLFALAFLLNGVLGVAFRIVGLDFSSWIVSIVTAAIVVNVMLVFSYLWAPLERKLVARRLSACGIPPAELERGICIGISDPASSAWKKAVLEDDIGMLWLLSDRLVYRGDSESIEIEKRDLLEIERISLSASTSAHAGNRHIVLRYKTNAGRERRTCLHTQGRWGMRGIVRATNELADRLTAWVQGT